MRPSRGTSEIPNNPKVSFWESIACQVHIAKRGSTQFYYVLSLVCFKEVKQASQSLSRHSRSGKSHSLVLSTVEMAQAPRNFKNTESTRPDFDRSTKFNISKTVAPDWKWGGGANDGIAVDRKSHIEIDPSDPRRSAIDNYKLLISGIIPRPIGFLSTRGQDGSRNLAPFSYMQVVNHDPPVFVVGFAGSADKDTLRNLKSSGECVINIISEHFIEAANATAIDAPYGLSEWQLTGLTPAPASQVKPDRVQESIFSVEGTLLEIRDFESKFRKGEKSGSMAIIEGVRFWVREDALSKDQATIDPAVLRPVARLGGMMYGLVKQGFEIPRPRYAECKDHLSRNGLNS